MKWWVRDDEGRVFGPAELGVLQDLLVRGRLRYVSEFSNDGFLWAPVAESAELAPCLVQKPVSDEPRVLELQALLASWQGKSAQSVFGVRPDAGFEELRLAYLPMVKEFHPARLPKDASVRLRAVTVEIFQYLGALMKKAQGTVSQPPPVRPLPRTSPPPPQPQAPSWSLEEFVGFDRKDDKLEMRVVLTPERVGLLTDHPLMNLKMGAMFVPTETPPALGMPLELVLVVGHPAKEVRASGKVAWACVPGGRGQPGVGVSFTQIDPKDKTLLEGFARDATLLRNRR